jgi:hypothetical protein
MVYPVIGAALRQAAPVVTKFVGKVATEAVAEGGVVARNSVDITTNALRAQLPAAPGNLVTKAVGDAVGGATHQAMSAASAAQKDPAAGAGAFAGKGAPALAAEQASSHPGTAVVAG